MLSGEREDSEYFDVEQLRRSRRFFIRSSDYGIKYLP